MSIKNLALGVCLVSALLSGNTNKPSNYYPLAGIVVEVNETTDIVAIQDGNGNVWELFGTEDWEVNDLCAMIMNSHGTATIYDDSIENIRYCGRAKFF